MYLYILCTQQQTHFMAFSPGQPRWGNTGETTQVSRHRQQMNQSTHHPVSPHSSPLNYLPLINFCHFLLTIHQLVQVQSFQIIANHLVSSILKSTSRHLPPHKPYICSPSDCHPFLTHADIITTCSAVSSYQYTIVTVPVLYCFSDTEHRTTACCQNLSFKITENDTIQ